MSLMPYMMNFGLTPVERYFNHFFNDMTRDLGRYERPYWIGHQSPLTFASTIGDIQDDEGKFSVSVDVSQFAPNELKVATVGDQLVIEGNHDEKTDEHGQIERRFVRKYALPKGIQQEAFVSHLTRDGVLTVSAPKNAIEGPPSRAIPIQAAPEQRKAIQGDK